MRCISDSCIQWNLYNLELHVGCINSAISSSSSKKWGHQYTMRNASVEKCYEALVSCEMTCISVYERSTLLLIINLQMTDDILFSNRSAVTCSFRSWYHSPTWVCNFWNHTCTVDHRFWGHAKPWWFEPSWITDGLVRIGLYSPISKDHQ